ncbi:hypothetical protein [Jiella marina]|uniref:hypothetical protein n=1 Tax=Jiella sp. LLJ827 TaxID=2917712 RepID=UPI0021017335|nr:hypothetical protein [Jiella sp. LLJ827]MCQ0986401.1 hypothetical protein [Jiella sp. LLJ827]
MAEIVVKLARRYDHGSTPFEELRFREPKLKDYMALGEVVDTNNRVVVVYNEALWKYAERLLIAPANFGAVLELDLVDTETVKAKLLDFFSDAINASRGPTNSSSGSDGTPDASRS